MPNPVPPEPVNPFGALDPFLNIKTSKNKLLIDEFIAMDQIRKQQAYDSMSANRKILEQKNGRIAELSLTLEQYSGCLTQNDIMKIVNRVAELNGLPKFFPKGRQQHPLNKTLFVNELSNYLFAATSRPDVDTLAE